MFFLTFFSPTKKDFFLTKNCSFLPKTCYHFKKTSSSFLLNNTFQLKTLFSQKKNQIFTMKVFCYEKRKEKKKSNNTQHHLLPVALLHDWGPAVLLPRPPADVQAPPEAGNPHCQTRSWSCRAFPSPYPCPPWTHTTTHLITTLLVTSITPPNPSGQTR